MGSEPRMRRRFVSDLIPGQPVQCSWCGTSIGDASFTALALDHQAAICNACIERYAVISRLGRLKGMYGQSEAHWNFLREQMRREIGAELATNEMRATALDVCQRLARRSCSVLNGFLAAGYVTDPNIGIDLRPQTISIMDELGLISQLIRRGCECVGMPVIDIDDDNPDTDTIKTLILSASMADSLVAEHVVVIATSEIIVPNSPLVILTT